MKTPLNLVLVIAAVAAWIFAPVACRHLRALEKTSHDAASVVLRSNEAMKTRIDTLKTTLAQQQAGAGADGATIDAELAAMRKADSERRAKEQAQNEANEKKLAARMRTDPEFALKRYASLRADAEIKHVPFCRLQQLSQEQSDALAEAEFQWRLRMDDLQTAQTLDEPGVDEKALRKAASDEFASNVRTALGDDLYEQFQDYKRKDAAWNYVKYYGGDMSLGDMPMSLEQSAQLVDAIANACPQYQKGKWVDMRAVDWDAVDAAAVDILTPEQLDYFKNAAVLRPSNQALGGGMPRQLGKMYDAVEKLDQ